MITRNPHLLNGQPIIQGRRLSVFNVVYGIYLDGLKNYIEDHELSEIEAKHALEYCKELVCQKMINGENFCDGCILRSIQNGSQLSKDKLNEITSNGSKFTIVDKNRIFFGSVEDYENALFGQVGWGIAEYNFKKYFQIHDDSDI
jgi:uncharacterized protein (DUF433 family)